MLDWSDLSFASAPSRACSRRKLGIAGRLGRNVLLLGGLDVVGAHVVMLWVPSLLMVLGFRVTGLGFRVLGLGFRF